MLLPSIYADDPEDITVSQQVEVPSTYNKNMADKLTYPEREIVEAVRQLHTVILKDMNSHQCADTPLLLAIIDRLAPKI